MARAGVKGRRASRLEGPTADTAARHVTETYKGEMRMMNLRTKNGCHAGAMTRDEVLVWENAARSI